jgi:hypothetical protein
MVAALAGRSRGDEQSFRKRVAELGRELGMCGKGC